MNLIPQYPSLSAFPSVAPIDYASDNVNDYYIKNIKIYKINNFIDNIIKEHNVSIEDDITLVISNFSEDFESFRIVSITTNKLIINELNNKPLSYYCIETPVNVKPIMMNLPHYLQSSEKFLKVKSSNVYTFNTFYTFALILAFNC